MRTAGIIGTSLILLFCSAYCAHANAAENCHTPSVQTLITWYNATYPKQPLRYSRGNSAVYHPIDVFQTAQPHVNWIGLAWLSPVWGALFAANCEGKPLAALSVGAVGKITAGPVLPALGKTVMFEYVDHEDTDCVHDSIGIVSMKDGEIISLWKHGYKQGMNITGSGTAFNGFVSTRNNVTFSEAGQIIQVSGNSLAYPYLKNGIQAPTPSATKVLTAETYHWNAKTLHFLPEKNYPQPKTCTRTGWPNVK